jgi:hypothetical protein
MAAVPGDSFLPTLGAPVVPPPLQSECHLSVRRASHDQALRSSSSSIAGGVGVLRRRCPQSVSFEPHADRGRRPFHLGCDLGDGHTGIDQRLQALSWQATNLLVAVRLHVGPFPSNSE